MGNKFLAVLFWFCIQLEWFSKIISQADGEQVPILNFSPAEQKQETSETTKKSDSVTQ